MALTKVHSRMIEGDYANVKDYGAVGDNVADDSAAVQAALDANDRIYFPAGEYQIKDIAIDGFRKEIFAPKGAWLRHNFADSGASNMFRIAENSDVQFFTMNIDRITMAASGGHIFRFFGAMNHSKINVYEIDHNALDKSIIYVNDTSFFFNQITGLFWRISEDHTQPAIRISSTSNKISANEFDILRPDRSGSRHFMELISTSTTDYNYSNLIKLSNPEVCSGGVLKLQRAMNTVIERMHCFDTGITRDTVNHMVHIGTSGYLCQNTKINDYQRNSGTLGTGLKDIFLGDANTTFISNPSGISSGSLIEIDVNDEPNTTILGGGFYNVSNATTSNTVILSAQEGLSTPKLLITPQAGELTIASGAVTVTDSVHRLDTESNAASDDLDTVNGGTDGYILILKTVSNSRDVTVKDGTGNLYLAGDFTLSNTEDTITLRFDALIDGWVEVSRSDNAT